MVSSSMVREPPRSNLKLTRQYDDRGDVAFALSSRKLHSNAGSVPRRSQTVQSTGCVKGSLHNRVTGQVSRLWQWEVVWSVSVCRGRGLRSL